MERRRGVSKRPASTEGSPVFQSKCTTLNIISEVECWSHAAASLSTLSELSTDSSAHGAIVRVNKLSLVWPTDEVLPAEGIDSVKTVYKELMSRLSEIKSISEREVK